MSVCDEHALDACEITLTRGCGLLEKTKQKGGISAPSHAWWNQSFTLQVCIFHHESCHGEDYLNLRVLYDMLQTCKAH